MYIECLLKIEGGIIALVGASEEFEENTDIKYQSTDYGINVSIGAISLPLPWNIAEYLIESGQGIYLYSYDADNYVGEYIATATLNRDQLLKMLGVWESRAVQQG